MLSKAVVFVLASFLLVVLIFSLYSIPAVARQKVTYGPIECTKSPSGLFVTCCQTQTDASGLELRYCTFCDNTNPPSNCGPRVLQWRLGSGNATGVPTPAGSALPPPGNNTGTTTKVPTGATSVGNALPPPGNNTGTTTKLPPGAFKPTGNVTNALPTGSNTSNIIAKAAGAYSPTGYCARSVSTTCLPCDPGLPGGQDTCIPSGQWPGSISFKNNSGLTTAAPLGNAMNAPPTSNNTSTLKLSPLTGQQTQTQQTTGHHHKGSNTGASSTGNSTGH